MSAVQTILKYYPFGRLARLLDGHAPGDSGIDVPGHPRGAPIALSIGEPRDDPPDIIAEALRESATGWSRYPPPRGTPEYLEACAAWLGRRYGLPEGMVHPATAIAAVPGTREGLFFAALAAMPAETGTDEGAMPRPAVLMPNPCYHVYPSAAVTAGAEPVLVPATAESGHLPDFAALAEETLNRAVLAYYCSPANPQGAAAGKETFKGLITLARRHGFVVAFDECYAETYTSTPPAGALQAVAELGGALDNVLVFHSLSKRSSAPGLRCGFVAGDPALIEAIDTLMRTGGAGVPFPTLAAGARLWADDEHARRIRARYQKNFAIAERILGNRFYFRMPDGGFFLWLDVGDGEAAALKLWREAGIRVLPGAYMCREMEDGSNPGANYIRVALVYDPTLSEAALVRLVEVLSP